MITVNAMGDACPIPVVKTKKAMEALTAPEVIETLVDNEIAVENLTKMAKQMGFAVESEKIAEAKYSVKITVDQLKPEEASAADVSFYSCAPADRTVVVIRTDHMGEGSEELGKTLLKGFFYALSQQEKLPKTILFYNGGARVTCEGSASLEDLTAMKEQGVEILTCGTCLNFYGLSDKLAVGEVTNMYEIVKRMSEASLIVTP